jgi:heme oxygenase
MPVVRDYERHVINLERNGILAHIYVRHFGDMYGGQMIRKRNPGSGTMYDFDNVDELKTTVRSMLNDDMAEEANRCFEFAMQLFEELERE